jgi:hypothetical protein
MSLPPSPTRSYFRNQKQRSLCDSLEPLILAVKKVPQVSGAFASEARQNVIKQGSAALI